MKVKDLKEVIENLPDDMEVIVQGAGQYSYAAPLAHTDSNTIYRRSQSWCGNVHNVDLSAEEVPYFADAWEDMKKQPRVLFLAPKGFPKSINI